MTRESEPFIKELKRYDDYTTGCGRPSQEWVIGKPSPFVKVPDTCPSAATPSFDEFARQARDLVDAQAASKGYNSTGAEGPNALFDFTHNMGLSHAEGEIVYKVVRWHSKRDKADLLKIVGWAFLLWIHSK